MAIKNYTSDKPLERIFAELQQTLGTHGAKHISFEYGDDGKVYSLTFTIKVHERFIPTKLPARVEIFLPYMLDKQGVTFFERMEQRHFLLERGKGQE